MATPKHIFRFFNSSMTGDFASFFFSLIGNLYIHILSLIFKNFILLSQFPLLVLRIIISQSANIHDTLVLSGSISKQKASFIIFIIIFCGVRTAQI